MINKIRTLLRFKVVVQIIWSGVLWRSQTIIAKIWIVNILPVADSLLNRRSLERLSWFMDQTTSYRLVWAG